jgi:hypothetical protein
MASIPVKPRLSRPRRAIAQSPLVRRALAIWPRLDHRALARCAHDPAALAAHVARRTKLPPETIRAILDPPVGELDGELWFG